MKTLPLFYHPTTWIWIDDDQLLPNTMMNATNQNNKLVSFASPEKCLSFLQSYRFPLSNYQFIESDIHDENYGLINKNPLNFDVTQIAKLYNDENRHNEISVAIIDYEMPEMDGLSLANKIDQFAIQKILLTGNTKEKIAIDGFNNNLIQKFVQKASAHMHEELTHYTRELSWRYFENKSKPLLNYLESENKTPLSDPVFIDYFENHCRENMISEFYLIDKNGSFLCIDDNGKESVFITHTENSISEWLAIYRDEQAIPGVLESSIREHKKIPFFGIGKEPWQIPTDQWSTCFYHSTCITGREKYFVSTDDAHSLIK